MCVHIAQQAIRHIFLCIPISPPPSYVSAPPPLPPLLPLRSPLSSIIPLQTNPKGEDMDADDLVDAKVPSDLMVSVEAAPSNLNLVARPKPPPASSKKAKGAAKGARGRGRYGRGAAGSTTAAEAAEVAVPLGGGRSTARSTTRSTRSSGRKAAVAEEDIIVLD